MKSATADSLTADQSHQIVQKLWNYCNVLRDDGMSYGDYVEQLTYLLFLKMADERSKPPYNQKSAFRRGMTGRALMKKTGMSFSTITVTPLKNSARKGLLGLIFGKAQNKFQDPAKLRRLIVDLIDKENWSIMSADVKGDAYEDFLKRTHRIKSGAGQYFTPRPLIRAIVDVMAPKPKETICDPACGTGGFLLAAHEYVTHHFPNMTRDEKEAQRIAFRGWELVHNTARFCAMNMMLHGIGGEKLPLVVSDSLAGDPATDMKW